MSKVVILGVDDEGRSTFRSVRTTRIERGDAARGTDVLHRTAPWPGLVGGAAPAAPPLRIDLEPGALRTVLVEFGPSTTAAHHRTTSLDHDVIVSGSVTVESDDDAVELVAGDVVVVEGAMHTWRAGPDGCVMAVTMIGLPA